MSIDTTDIEIELQQSLMLVDTNVSKLMDSIHKHIHSNNEKVDILAKVSYIMTKLAETKYTLKSNIEKINSGIQIYDKMYVDTINRKSETCGIVSKPIVPNIYTHVVEVETLDAIPNIPLCYVKSLGQFAIKINEVIIRGNVGNIVQNTRGYNCIIECTDENCTTPTCNKWHDPYKHEYLNYYFEDNSNYTKKQIRNFSARSWMYSPKKYINNMRHIGTRDTFYNDMHYIDKYESNLIIGQTMHDILTCISMAKNSNSTVGIENIHK